MSRRGSAAIEFAITLPFLLAIASVVIDYGWYLTQSVNVLHATREGLRIGAATPWAEGPDTTAEVQAEATLVGYGVPCGEDLPCEIRAALVEVDGYDAINLTVVVPFVAFFGLVPTPDTMRAELTMAIEDMG